MADDSDDNDKSAKECELIIRPSPFCLLSRRVEKWESMGNGESQTMPPAGGWLRGKFVRKPPDEMEKYLKQKMQSYPKVSHSSLHPNECQAITRFRKRAETNFYTIARNEACRRQLLHNSHINWLRNQPRNLLISKIIRVCTQWMDDFINYTRLL